MRIQHNILAMNAYRNYNTNTSALAKNLEKLSSGYKINRAGDDAAGLAISEKMRAQITGLNAAQKNVKDGISLVKTAEGAMQEIQDMLNRMDYLATQSANGTYDNPVDRLNLQKEVDALKTEINRIADSANFNGIKLLDGSLGEKTIDTMGIDVNQVNMADGINVNSPVEGAAVKASAEINFDPEKLFSPGDSLTLKVKDADGNEQTITATGVAGSDFAAQMASLASSVQTALNNAVTAADASSETYTVTATDTGIKIESASEDIPALQVVDGSAAIVRNSAVAKAETTTPGAAAGTPGSAATVAFEDLIGGTNATQDIDVGDTLTFDFTVNGKNMKVTLTAVGADETVAAGDKTFKIGGTIADTMNNITAALNSAYFDDNTATSGTKTNTGIDESQLKVSDYFTIGANKKKDGSPGNGSIQFAPGSAADASTKANSVVFDHGGTASSAISSVVGTAAVADSGTAAVPQVTTVSLNKNMAVGDKFVLEGDLSDGRTFKVELEAVASHPSGNQFVLGADAEATLNAIKAAMANADITVTNPDNSTSPVKGNLLFASGQEFQFGTAAAGTGDAASITITSEAAGVPGKGVAGKINRAYTENAEAPKITSQSANVAKEASTSENTLTFDGDLVEQGTTVTIDGTTYEFVSDAANITHPDNKAVVVSQWADGNAATGEDLARALESALDGTNSDGVYDSAASKAYDLSVVGNSLTIKSQDTGSDGKALDVKVGETKPSTTLTIKGGEKEVLGEKVPLDVSSVKAGDTVTINGKVYEFTANGKRTQNENAVAVALTDNDGKNKITTASGVAAKLAEVVSANDSSIVARADGRDVIFTSKYNDQAAKVEDAYAAPKVELPKSSNSLTLQIGDTSDKWNQMSVKIGDMHTNAMGTGKTTLNNEEIDVTKTIADIDISTQTGAQDAIAVIKNAINYVSGVRGDLGAVQNRLDHTANNLSMMVENIQDAESTIRDTDIAEEMMAYTKNNILIQSAQAMLAQANAVPQGVLQLLG